MVLGRNPRDEGSTPSGVSNVTTTKEAFAQEFAQQHGWTLEQFNQRMDVLPCECKTPTCRGWRPQLKHRPKLEELSMLPDAT